MQTIESFLSVTPSALSDEPACADAQYLESKGCAAASADVLRAMLRVVVPSIQALERQGMSWYSLLVHDRSSGVPTAKCDSNLYIHLRARFVTDQEIVFPLEWEMTRAIELPTAIAGVDSSCLSIPRAWELIGLQSRWYIDLLMAGDSGDELATLKHVRQFLHYFANMAQMRVA